jgi:hypothetical protein
MDMSSAACVVKLDDATDRRSNTRAPSEWSQIISASWRDNAVGIFTTGSHLRAACDQLGKDYVITKLHLPFGKRTAERLMAIASNSLLATHVSQLPPCWGTLYVLSRLKDEILRQALDSGAIHPGMERKDVKALKSPSVTRSSAPTSKPSELSAAWKTASVHQRRQFLDQLGREGLCAAMSDNLKADFQDHAVGLTINRASKASPWAVNATNKLHSAMRIAEQEERDHESLGRLIGALRCIALTAERRGITRSDIVIAQGKSKGRKS